VHQIDTPQNPIGQYAANFTLTFDALDPSPRERSNSLEVIYCTRNQGKIVNLQDIALQCVNSEPAMIHEILHSSTSNANAVPPIVGKHLCAVDPIPDSRSWA
jgi:hypothetical protein